MQRIVWIIIIVSAIILDYFLEYPNPAHPTVWMGKIIAFFDNHRLAKTNGGLIINGIVPILVDTILFFLLVYLVGFLPLYFELPIYIYLAKSTFSIGGLVRALKKCETDDLENLRFNVSMIVSRDTRNLDMQHLYSAAFESGAESIIDSIISPLFYLFLFGLYGALFYRIVNTADSMVGYRNEKYEYFGKFSARMDDVLNFIPARIYYVFLLILGGRYIRGEIKNNNIKMNGKYSIVGTAALFRLGVEKIGFYKYDGGRFPNPQDLNKLEKFIFFISYIFAFIMIMLTWFLGLPIYNYFNASSTYFKSILINSIILTVYNFTLLK
mgnify:CR=1 FL=1